jgi:hypothetical protein
MLQTFSSLQIYVAAFLLFVLVLAFIIGRWLRAAVKQSSLHPSLALRVIETIAVVIGGGIGSVAVILLLIILWPAAGNWIINTFLPDAIIWQTQFQQWITRIIDDPTISSAIGLLIQRLQFGSAFLGFVAGWAAKWLIETVMGKSYHAALDASKMAATPEMGSDTSLGSRNFRTTALRIRGRP